MLVISVLCFRIECGWLKIRCHSNRNKYDNSGIYQLTCPTSHKKYPGQTGRSFRTRFLEQFRDFRYRNYKSSFAQHLLENRHSIGSMEDTMETVHVTKKSHLMNTLEKFYIFRETKLNNQINDKSTVKPNAIFDVIIQNDPHKGIPNTRNSEPQ